MVSPACVLDALTGFAVGVVFCLVVLVPELRRALRLLREERNELLELNRRHGEAVNYAMQLERMLCPDCDPPRGGGVVRCRLHADSTRIARGMWS